ncbi:MAG: multifunctional CCA addition/repair protein [Gammaproteobacteria bacterium]
MECYLVGGAVRDKLLNLPVKDRDWVVVGASVEEMLGRGFQQVGKNFPVFLHPDTREEYALARTESKTAPGHTGFSIDASADISLEDDLRRRDLTINAIAETIDGELVDPYNGREDIEARLLRHVSDAFSEDPLRVLRVARFAARFHHLGFTVADETLALMRDMTAGGELQTLVAERVWHEIQLAMASPAPQRFVQVLRDANALAVILPEVDSLFGVPQPEKYHPEIDTGVHVLMCLEQAVKLSDDPRVAWSVLVHDVGKAVTDPARWPSHYGHEGLGVGVQKKINQRLPVPNDYAQLAALVSEHHTKLHRVSELRPSTLLKLLESLDAFRRPERLHMFLDACEADSRGRTGLELRPYPQRDYLLTVLHAASAVDIAAQLTEQPGRKPESVVSAARLAAIEEALDGLRKNA